MKYFITIIFLIMVGGDAVAQHSHPQEYPYIHYIDSIKVMTMTHTQASKLDIKADLADLRMEIINEQDILIDRQEDLILNQQEIIITQKEIIQTQEERFNTQQEIQKSLDDYITRQKKNKSTLYIVGGAVIGSILLFR